jgi:hypothetical protein
MWPSSSLPAFFRPGRPVGNFVKLKNVFLVPSETSVKTLTTLRKVRSGMAGPATPPELIQTVRERLHHYGCEPSTVGPMGAAGVP